VAERLTAALAMNAVGADTVLPGGVRDRIAKLTHLLPADTADRRCDGHRRPSLPLKQRDQLFEPARR
jgi:hypothetical protein